MWHLEPLLLAQRGACEGGGRAGPPRGSTCLEPAVPQRGGSGPELYPGRSRAVWTLGSSLEPGRQVWLSCSQGQLAVESASHKGWVRSSQKMPFQ